MYVVTNRAVVPGYYLVCYNNDGALVSGVYAVVPGYYLVCYNIRQRGSINFKAVVPGYYLVCYNPGDELTEAFWL